MKRNWMSTGRKPTGLCGAAILLSARIHGIKKNQNEICKIVRIGIQALRCRLLEVEKTSIKKPKSLARKVRLPRPKKLAAKIKTPKIKKIKQTKIKPFKLKKPTKLV
jgi:transcription initiation factor TFIIIB Brf1 subunit/transcription initiation factor TFIIB